MKDRRSRVTLGSRMKHGVHVDQVKGAISRLREKDPLPDSTAVFYNGSSNITDGFTITTPTEDLGSDISGRAPPTITNAQPKIQCGCTCKCVVTNAATSAQTEGLVPSTGANTQTPIASKTNNTVGGSDIATAIKDTFIECAAATEDSAIEPAAAAEDSAIEPAKAEGTSREHAASSEDAACEETDTVESATVETADEHRIIDGAVDMVGSVATPLKTMSAGEIPPAGTGTLVESAPTTTSDSASPSNTAQPHSNIGMHTNDGGLDVDIDTAKQALFAASFAISQPEVQVTSAGAVALSAGDAMLLADTATLSVGDATLPAVLPVAPIVQPEGLISFAGNIGRPGEQLDNSNDEHANISHEPTLADNDVECSIEGLTAGAGTPQAPTAANRDSEHGDMAPRTDGTGSSADPSLMSHDIVCPVAQVASGLSALQILAEQSRTLYATVAKPRIGFSKYARGPSRLVNQSLKRSVMLRDRPIEGLRAITCSGSATQARHSEPATPAEPCASEPGTDKQRRCRLFKRMTYSSSSRVAGLLAAVNASLLGHLDETTDLQHRPRLTCVDSPMAADEPPPRPETGVAGPSDRLAAAAEAAGPPLGLVTTMDGGGEASFDDTYQQRDDTGAQQLPHQADDDGDDELYSDEQRGDGGAQHLPPQVDDDDDGLTDQGEHDAVPSYIRGWRTHPGEPDDGPLSGDYSSVSVIDTLRFRSQRKWAVYSEPPSPAEMIDSKKAARREARQVARKVAPKIIPGLHRRRSSLTYLADRLVAYKQTTTELIEWVGEDLRAIVEARRVHNAECTRVPTPDAPIPLQTQPNASREEPNGPVVEAATQPDRRSGSWRSSSGGDRQQTSQQPRQNTLAVDSRTPAPQPNASKEEPNGPVVGAASQPDRRSGSWRSSSGGGRQQASQQPRRNTSAVDSRTPAPQPDPQDPTSGGQQHGSFVERNGDGHRRRRRHHKRGGNNNGGG
ncbi:hypothetical protein H4S07_001139 [Coemansia furcata]|uniref:Uncharacterized protein n=1 Tax=Coemansia furcata TaxID=417177 RepID=A0ACC1LP75_9FUNG|nr:hypothetical protein H4S07_001139 [Coemansia furcata]